MGRQLIDTIILAAGRGSRLDGIAAPFHKPLMVINGRPMIRNAIEQSRREVFGDVIVVSAPENTLPLSQVLTGIDAKFIVQREPQGPGAALALGLQLVTTEKVLILMGDNTLQSSDVAAILDTAESAEAVTVVGTHRVPSQDAERFTFLDEDGKWKEKVKPVSNYIVDCWIGPILADTQDIADVLEWWREKAAQDEELPIGPLFNHLKQVSTVPVSCEDIGIPEAL